MRSKYEILYRLRIYWSIARITFNDTHKMLKVILFQCLTGVILEQYFPIFEHCVRNVMKLEQIIK